MEKSFIEWNLQNKDSFFSFGNIFIIKFLILINNTNEVKL